MSWDLLQFIHGEESAKLNASTGLISIGLSARPGVVTQITGHDVESFYPSYQGFEVKVSNSIHAKMVEEQFENELNKSVNAEIKKILDNEQTIEEAYPNIILAGERIVIDNTENWNKILNSSGD
ncbi:hypothetical protein M4D81_32945 [Paenibacillus sp. p3-SID867]|uniref:hypothetical protein n=1 Tax=Paenibacillus sp. p3-SID867 TaxID=2916363 RepID=UPI0021A2E482|nr:hypothetical protein [Paenibacillus sp. p3-SID867]MCT1403816.1 hypothetical protein [Paenibacillus sp. p3-SID867]